MITARSRKLGGRSADRRVSMSGRAEVARASIGGWGGGGGGVRAGACPRGLFSSQGGH